MQQRQKLQRFLMLWMDIGHICVYRCARVVRYWKLKLRQGLGKEEAARHYPSFPIHLLRHSFLSVPRIHPSLTTLTLFHTHYF